MGVFIDDVSVITREATMGTYLNPGNGMFQMMRDSPFYVDKTDLISFVNARIGQENGRFIAVSRPRRFGKSVDANMLVAYYDRSCDSRQQFEGLSITGQQDFETHLNKHDVIKLDITQVLPYAKGFLDIGPAISRELMKDLAAQWPTEAAAAEGQLFKALDAIAQSKGSGFIFVIDEWDCPMRETDDCKAQRAYLDFLRDLLKGRLYVEACYMTGILPIRKYGRHSALNLFREYSMTKPRKLAGLMGFSEEQVQSLCTRFGMNFEEMRRWYDGYVLGPGRNHVYNPNSVACAISEEECSSYWTETETYEALQAYIDMDFDGIQQDLVAMLDGQHVFADVNHFQNDMHAIRDKDDMYALLVHLGYLGYDQAERAVFIPNEEIRREFAASLRTGKRTLLAALIRDSKELQDRTLGGDESYVAGSITKAHESAAGPRHYNSEEALRAAVKLAYIWSVDDYLRVDELPGGRGYADVVFIPKPATALPPMVIELKWDKPVEAAIEQIHLRNYPAALAGLSGECLLVGITYHEGTDVHECRIERIVL